MEQQDPAQTDPKNPEGTGGNTDPKGGDNPAATPPETDPKDDSSKGKGPAPGEKMVSISEKDYKKLQSQRDSSNDRLGRLEAQAMQDAFEKEASSYLSQHKDDYPDVEVSDLQMAEAPEDFEKLAKQAQARIDKATQRRLGEMQKKQTPSISSKDKAARLKQLKDKPGSNSFQSMLELEGQPVNS